VETVRDLLSIGDDHTVALLDHAGNELTYRALRERVDALAESFRATGVATNDRIAIVLPNGPEMAIAFLAAASVGCVAPLNPKYTEPEFRFYLDDLHPHVLVTPAQGHPDAEAAAGDGIRCVALEGSMRSVAIRVEETDAMTSPAGQPSENDVGLILHTSGTTSRPKIVPLRHRNLVASANNVATSLQLDAADRSLNVMPLFHIHGLVAGLLAPLSVGASVVCTPGFDAFKIHEWIERHEPTYYSAVPTMHQMVLARAGAPRRTSLRFVRSSSASLPTAVLHGLEELFGVPVIEAYGMTEAAHQMAVNPLPPGAAKPGSVGCAAGIQLAILAEDGSERGPGETGEVGIRGPTVIVGYENNEAANVAAFTDGGWFRTGDQGYLDEDGYLFLTGRLKEQINRGGEKISPLEIDEVLTNHPDVDQAVAFAIAHAVLGEEVAAAVVLRAGSELSVADLRAFASAHLAAFKVPRQVFVVDEIPKGPTGKVQRVGLAKVLGVESSGSRVARRREEKS
jgi:acyl-CoA synthetase (AMP-forming)/AMP-acid ligase II